MNAFTRPTGRAAALAALEDWKIRRSTMESERAQLMADAWNIGARTIAELARAAGVTRDTVYSDLRTKKIDYHNKDQDPLLTRLVQAVTALAMEFNAGHPYSWKTQAEFGPALAEAASLLVSFQGPELVLAVGKVLAVVPVGAEDQAMLKPVLDELRAALADYTAPPISPITRFVRDRSAGWLAGGASEPEATR